MKKLLLFFLLFVSIISIAQKGLDEMIAAERNFAAFAVANNTKEAFLKFMDTAAIMFENGEPYKAYEKWQKRDKLPGVLAWWPLYAEIATSGDFGYTCGPWTFQPSTVKDSVVANGFFFTIWQKNKAGEWKFILDVGTDSGTKTAMADTMRISEQKTKGTELTLQEAEEAYLLAYKTSEAKAVQDFMSKNVIAVSQDQPSLSKENRIKLPVKSSSGGSYQFTYQGGGIASSGDLGYAYGSAIRSPDAKKQTYLRIWRHEPGGWKIVLQMLRF